MKLAKGKNSIEKITGFLVELDAKLCVKHISVYGKVIKSV